MVRSTCRPMATILGSVCGALLGACAGCINVDTRPPDVRIDSGPSAPPTADSPPVRSKPYASALDRVLRQQTAVEKELRKRDWKELREKLDDWQKQVRKLNGMADTSDHPARLRELCEQLLARVDAMRRATRSQDAAGVQKSLDEAEPILNRMSSEFPLTEPTTQSVIAQVTATRGDECRTASTD